MFAPSRYIVEKLGPTYAILVSTILGGVLTAIIPMCAIVNVWLVIGMRFITGFAGVTN